MNAIVQGKERGKFGTGSTTTNRRKQQKSKARSDDDVVIDVDARNEGSGKKRKTSRHFQSSNHSSDSPGSSSVNQGDDGFYAEGEWQSQGSGGHKVDDMVMAALDGANQYVQPRERENSRKAKPNMPTLTAITVTRDPVKNASANRNRRKCRVVIIVSRSRLIAIVLIIPPPLSSSF